MKIGWVTQIMMSILDVLLRLCIYLNLSTTTHRDLLVERYLCGGCHIYALELYHLLTKKQIACRIDYSVARSINGEISDMNASHLFVRLLGCEQTSRIIDACGERTWIKMWSDFCRKAGARFGTDLDLDVACGTVSCDWIHEQIRLGHMAKPFPCERLLLKAYLCLLFF